MFLPLKNGYNTHIMLSSFHHIELRKTDSPPCRNRISGKRIMEPSRGLGIVGEGPFIFRVVGRSGIYLQEDGEQAKSFWCFRVHESEVKHLRGLGRKVFFFWEQGAKTPMVRPQ